MTRSSGLQNIILGIGFKQLNSVYQKNNGSGYFDDFLKIYMCTDVKYSGDRILNLKYRIYIHGKWKARLRKAQVIHSMYYHSYFC